jgi:GT2 family glycosyltransferase
VDLVEELRWLAFFVPRQGVQWLARRLPLAALRERLPRVIGDRLRMGLYPARVTDARAVDVPRVHAAWGDPAELDAARVSSQGAAPRVSILMVTYGNLALTRLCLASVQRAAGATPFEVIAVDNASPDGDGTVAWLRAQESLLPLTVIANAHNAGFAAANNQAAARARGDVLVFLNNDTVVPPGWLERLLAPLDEDPRVGLVGPTTNSCGNEARIDAPYAALAELAPFAAERARTHAGRRRELPMLELFCAAMPRALFEAIGGLDERYRVGLFEDDDLAMAVRARDRRVVLAEDAFVHHFGGAAFSRLPPSRYLRIWWQNRRQFEAKWGTRWQPR